MYPIAWGIADGGNVIGADGEMIFYGILDILAKPVFCFFHVWSMRGLEYEIFQLQSGKASVGARVGGSNGAKSAGFPGTDIGGTGTGTHPTGVNSAAVTQS